MAEKVKRDPLAAAFIKQMLARVKPVPPVHVGLLEGLILISAGFAPSSSRPAPDAGNPTPDSVDTPPRRPSPQFPGGAQEALYEAMQQAAMSAPVVDLERSLRARSNPVMTANEVSAALDAVATAIRESVYFDLVTSAYRLLGQSTDVADRAPAMTAVEVGVQVKAMLDASHAAMVHPSVSLLADRLEREEPKVAPLLPSVLATEQGAQDSQAAPATCQASDLPRPLPSLDLGTSTPGSAL